MQTFSNPAVVELAATTLKEWEEDPRNAALAVAQMAWVSASHRGWSPRFCLAAENKQSPNQQRTFPLETIRHPSRAPQGPRQSPFTVCVWQVSGTGSGGGPTITRV